METKLFHSIIATTLVLASTIVQAVPNTFSGRAVVLDAEVLELVDITVADTGALPPTGGVRTAGPISVDINVPGALTATADVGTARTEGAGENARSFAELTFADVDVLVGTITVTADVLTANSRAFCNAQKQARLMGSSVVTNLFINGLPVVVTGAPNQTINVTPLVRVVVNEQRRTGGTGSLRTGEITVNALHIIVRENILPLLPPVTVADVILSSARSDITCRF